MASLIAGDIAALEVLYDRYSTLVFSVSLRVLYDRQLAEDVTQEVFLRLWRRPQSFDPNRGRLLSWLMSVTRNRAIDERRRLARRVHAEDPADEPLPDLRESDGRDDPQLALALAELRWKVREAMHCLPEAQRQVIELGYFGGLSQTEIAERTGLPLGTVKTRVRLAMSKLRAELQEFQQETKQ
jgi:RNA polymerase sigma-70 factor (ECF subfamily)